MTKIAIITTMEGNPWGGSEYLWAVMAERALEEGHEVLVSLHEWSVDHPLVVQLRKKGMQILPRPLPSKGVFSKIAKKVNQYLWLKAMKVKSTYKAVFDWQPDFICLSQGNTYEIRYNLDLLELLQSSSIPYTVVCHFNSDNDYPDSAVRSMTQALFARASCVAFVSQHNLKLAVRHLAQSLPHATVVQNPVNIQELTLVPWVQHSTVHFGVVARLDVSFKGQDVLFEALSLPPWQNRNWQCNLYGSGPDAAYLKALADHYGIADHVKLAGHVNGVRSIWSDNHLLILPSRGEGTPLALIEAMLCGRPAVVTDVGGNAEWIVEPKTGFIAEAPTAKSLSAALERAWITQDNWEQMGKDAHEYAVEKFEQFPGKALLDLVLNTKRM